MGIDTSAFLHYEITMSETIPAILLMWSGGISSTALLIDLLTDSKYKDHDIIVHHVHLVDSRNKALAEALSCKSVIEYVQNKKKYRKFFFAESTLDTKFMIPPRYSRNVLELDAVAFMAANIAAGNPGIDKVVFGTTKTDIDENESYRPLLEKASKIFETSVQLLDHAPDLSLEYPYAELTMKQAYTLLPPPLRRKVVSCATPAYPSKSTFKACGKCYKCKYRKIVSVAV
jgi:7-cyano-7-deazaguanine synthase in queuosine biosynthesis